MVVTECCVDILGIAAESDTAPPGCSRWFEEAEPEPPSKWLPSPSLVGVASPDRSRPPPPPPRDDSGDELCLS